MKNKKPRIVKYVIILLLLVVLMSCESNPLVQPFVIISKYVNSNKAYNWYKYQDQNGNTEFFYDTREYSIGDTLK